MNQRNYETYQKFHACFYRGLYQANNGVKGSNVRKTCQHINMPENMPEWSELLQVHLKIPNFWCTCLLTFFGNTIMMIMIEKQWIQGSSRVPWNPCDRSLISC